MLLNTPVAASRSGGHLEIVKDGTNGRLFEVDDPTSMVDVQLTFFRIQPHSAMIRQAAKFAKRDFTEKHADCHRDISTVGQNDQICGRHNREWVEVVRRLSCSTS